MNVKSVLKNATNALDLILSSALYCKKAIFTMINPNKSKSAQLMDVQTVLLTSVINAETNTLQITIKKALNSAKLVLPKDFLIVYFAKTI